MNVTDRIEKTAVLFQAVTKLWNAEPVHMGTVHHIDPRMFHMLPSADIFTYQEGGVAHAEALVSSRGMFLRLYCGHNERCPLIHRIS